ncbi:hydrogen gas-evolving membrane-bound hydrogenase subunit E [Caenispirillum bisanense]|uniref:Multisubunit sodium/proton antiporter, MrpA subunit n=1 Tax=Caenispirillum bisanense TaxID=414052 RepID=A0A286G202_9PROT|nr:hydrogen gas-evolving membrane-bound hydrogenase subunit E [Caenispirillum bisanense]SOD89209.1 multisubunit sodium/proton antiporter, MrpA subunit [Caenispirillum bisanense]
MADGTVQAAGQVAVTPGGYKAPAWLGALFALPPALAALAFSLLLPGVAAGEAFEWSLAWAPQLGISFAFRIDGLALLFALLVTGIGAAVMLYSGVYLADHPRIGRFFLYLTLFMVSMLGLVTADDAIALFVFWELTTVTSFLLIGFTHDDPKSRRNALQALLLTGAGGLALLAGLLLLGQETGTLRLSQMDPAVVQASALLPGITVLVLIGCFTKSAQFPFHFWLPNAMSAPTPVSAYLHSATMVKAGIYLLARLSPSLGGSEIWVWSLTLAGAVTAVVGALWAVRQTDLKQMLAWTTVMALGTLTLLLAGSEPISIAAAMTFLVVHALYKATLFMVVGILDHEAGTRDKRLLGGLLRAMPLTAAAAALAAMSMGGFPPFLGFIGKELKYEGALALTAMPGVAAAGLVLASACMVAVAGMVAIGPFLGRERRAVAAHPHDPPAGMLVGPLLLAGLGLAFGLAPGLISGTLVQPAVTAVLGGPAEVKLKLWHGINVPLMLGLATFTLGIALYVLRRPVIAALDAVTARLPTTGDAAYDGALAGFKRLAAWQTDLLQSGRPRVYMATTVGTVAALALATLVAGGGVVMPAGSPAPDVLGLAAVAVAAAGTLLVVMTRSRLAAIGGLGMVGTAVALLFLMHGAVDVATTQFLVETLVVLLLAVALLRLPELTSLPARPLPTRLRDGLIAGAAGLTVTLVLLAVLAEPFDRRVTAFFEAASWPEAYGRNIVNVILVDFRALDTFGEIAVVAVAGLGAYALLRNDRILPKLPADSLILRTATRGLAALLLVFALFMLLRGHNAPGGGFIAGLIAATGFALLTIGHGVGLARRAMGAAPRLIALGGLGLALAAGMAGMVAGGLPFEGLWLFVGADPATGDKGLPLSTVLVFDIGVFLVVVGAVLAIVFALEEEA